VGQPRHSRSPQMVYTLGVVVVEAAVQSPLLSLPGSVHLTWV